MKDYKITFDYFAESGTILESRKTFTVKGTSNETHAELLLGNRLNDTHNTAGKLIVIKNEDITLSADDLLLEEEGVTLHMEPELEIKPYHTSDFLDSKSFTAALNHTI